jgi:hypothetical protein
MSARAFTIAGGVRHGWVVASAPEDTGATALAELAGQRHGFPALAYSCVNNERIFRVFELEDGIRLRRFMDHAGTPAPEVSARILVELARVVALAIDDARVRLSTDDFIITWSGRVSLLPPAAPRQWSIESFATRFPGWDGWDLGGTARTLAPAYFGESEARASFDDVDAAIREFARAVTPASDALTAETIAGLFPAEHAAARELMEQVGILDGDALEALLR